MILIEGRVTTSKVDRVQSPVIDEGYKKGDKKAYILMGLFDRLAQLEVEILEKGKARLEAGKVTFRPVGNLTRETIVDNITLYWLTGTGTSAARWYWEFGQVLAAAGAGGEAPPPVKVPVGFTTFPGEIWAAPRSWVETVYPGLAYFNEVDRGGHFAAWEEPELFTAELRAAFRSLR
jgi:hypothetical protein